MLYTERVCFALPAGHELATESCVDIAALADESVLRYADAQPEWNSFWTFDPRPDGRRPQPGPDVRDMEEIVAYVRAGRGVAFLPVPVTAAIAPPGVAFVPVDGIPPGQVVLAWDAGRAVGVSWRQRAPRCPAGVPRSRHPGVIRARWLITA